MVHAPTPNIVLLRANVILIKGTGDERSWELNLAALPIGLLYKLQEGLTNELQARESCALHTLMEQKVEL